jgi:multidrug efflux pump subunit AcrA (membrane-fusion protein)
MKKRSIVRLVLSLLAAVLVLGACNDGGDKKITVAHEHSEKEQYTCPMHPQIVQDKSGTCPICGMDLVPRQATDSPTKLDTSLAYLVKPVNEQVVANTPTISPESGTRIFSMEVQGSITYDTRRQTNISSRVSGRIERLLIKYNYQPVRKGQLIMEVYSPDLAAAQRELLFIYRNDRNSHLLQKAKQRLLLLGVQEGQIRQVLNSGQVIYRVPVYSNVSGYILEKGASASNTATVTTSSASTSFGSDGMGGMGSGGSTPSPAMGTGDAPVTTSPVLLREGQYVGAGQSLFTVYKDNSLVAEFAFEPSMAADIKSGQKLVFHKTADPSTVYTGTIGLIQPTFRAGTNFVIARVYLSDNRFQVGQLVTANVPILSRGWWVPESAVLVLGSRSVVFKKEGPVFVPKAVQEKQRANGLVLIEEGVNGWEIAENAAFLIDSESFIKVNNNHQTEETP